MFKNNYIDVLAVVNFLSIYAHIPFRFYSNWAFQTLDIQATDMDTYEPTESLEKVVIDILTQLLKLGTYISKQPKVGMLFNCFTSNNR